MADPILVDYAEKIDSVSGGVDKQGEFEQRVYTVAWADKSALMQQMSGASKLSGGALGKWVTSTPYQSPGNSRLFADSISWAPAGTPIIGSDPGEYSHADVTVIFRQSIFVGSEYDPQQTISPDEPLLQYATSEDVDFGTEWFTLPDSLGVKFASDGRLIKSAYGRHLTIITFTLTYERFPFMPFAYIKEYSDSINNASWCGCDKGSVMFLGPKVSRQSNNLVGQVGQRLVMQYKWRSVEWNKFLRDDSPTFDTVVNKTYTTGSTDAYATYAYKDFKKLLWQDFV